MQEVCQKITLQVTHTHTQTHTHVYTHRCFLLKLLRKKSRKIRTADIDCERAQFGLLQIE